MKPIILLQKRPLIYGILNTVNGKLYIGKTHCIYKRCHQYLRAIKSSNLDHVNEYLLNAIRKHGIENFEMFPLEFVDPEHLAERELWWMDHFNTLNPRKGYNLRYDSSSGMLAHTTTRRKISERLKKEWASGVRDGHSEKLKKSWENKERRKQQGELFSKIKTKYEYEVTYPTGETENCLYSRLIELGLKNVIANFHRTGKDETGCKGYLVKRIPRGE